MEFVEIDMNGPFLYIAGTQLHKKVLYRSWKLQKRDQEELILD